MNSPVRKRVGKGKALEHNGLRVESCFGPGGCQNRAVSSDGLPEEIERLFLEADFFRFLEEQNPGKKKPHRGLRVAVSDCPNACSQPQIKDIGIIGASVPRVTGEECTQCGACVEVCKEGSISLSLQEPTVQINEADCVSCGQCIPVCPTGTLAEGPKGFRVLLGGKLGRHPSLAREMPGLYSEEQVLDIIRECIGFYMANSRYGERLGHIFGSDEFEELVKRHSPLGTGRQEPSG